MNSEKLSKRLERVASFVPHNAIVADIGSDHAYLPCFLGLKKVIKKGIAGEITDGPFRSAKEQVTLDGLNDMIEVRKGDGLSVLEEDEAEVVTICGMGGSLITSILEKGKEKLGRTKRLILQPNIGARNVRNWLLKEGWVLVDEEILKEDGKIYEILVADREGSQPYTNSMDAEILFGPFLLNDQNEVFKEKWAGEVNQWKTILNQMENSQGKASEEKRKEIEKNLRLAEEWIL